MRISICTTNYNCAHALEKHLESVYRLLEGWEFEYIVVDNKSRDRSLAILQSWSSEHTNMLVLSKRCTMGEGRQIAFGRSSGNHVMVLDTDVIYNTTFRALVAAYFQRCPEFSLQAVFCGIFPRTQWVSAGGRRSLNTNEDVDLWIRIARLGTMRWYPVHTGENLKEAAAWGIGDYLSRRYSRGERILRLLRREWDLWKTRDIRRINLQALIEANVIDLGLGKPGPWPQSRTRQTRVQHTLEFARQLKQTVRTR